VRKELVESRRMPTKTDLRVLRIGLVAHDAAEFKLERALETAVSARLR
jgi:hypothetical protein